MQLKSLVYRHSKALSLFNRQRGFTLAAASSFYVVISIIPFLLLTLRFVGYLLGDLVSTEEQFFGSLSQIFPDAAPEILVFVRKILAGPLFGKGGMTLLNVFVLIVASMGVINSIWNGLYLMTGDKTHVSFDKHFKGVVIIAVTALLITVAFGAPPAVLWAIGIVKSNAVVDYLSATVPNFDLVMETINWVASVATYLVKSNFFYGLIFLVYFSFLYRWFFSWKISLKNAFYGALTFVITLLLGKNLFLIYFNYVRANLVRNYGDYYTFIVGMMWIFFVMCFFFYGACICHVYANTEGVDPAERIGAFLQRGYKKILVNFKLSFKKIASIICKNKFRGKK